MDQRKAKRRPRPRSAIRAGVTASLLVGVAAVLGLGPGPGGHTDVTTPMVVLGYNDLGMHCMNSDYSELLILPPFNTLHAQVLRRGAEPQIITSGVTVNYAFPSNTHSADKSNFWQYPQALLGNPAPNIGITGNGMTGHMTVTPDRDWSATGIPIVPIDDMGRDSPYNLASITVVQNGQIKAQTRAVTPTSTEMSCNLCHNTPGVSTASDILTKHDQIHGTTLMANRPVLCARCHSDNALGLPGQAGIESLSSAMHNSHATRVGELHLSNECYACHPGIRTNCLRDVHSLANTTCLSCHGTMNDVGNPARRPWIDEPRCSTCHARPGSEYEQPGVLYRNSVGHGGVHCAACHSSPHAITPAATEADNLQATLLQGHPGKIDTCTVCHTQQPTEPFFHRVGD